ncbi:MAG: hypothetical protein HZB91_11695 [Elusimicrobia bacterium]|nr:hypothetical protein [Elusimicrobiota bacterium]
MKDRDVALRKGFRLGAVLLTASPVLVAAAVGWGILHRVPRPAPASQPAQSLSQASQPFAPAADSGVSDPESVGGAGMTAPLAPPKRAGRLYPSPGEPETRQSAESEAPPIPPATDARPPMVERTPPRKRLDAKQSSSGVYESGKEVDGFRPLRLVTRDPAYEAALMRPAPPQSDNTDITRYMEQGCAGGKACGRDGKGKFFYTEMDGTRHTQIAYDQSKPLGERNQMEAEDPVTGKRRTYTRSPLVFDLKGRGVRSSDRIVRFNLAGEGNLERIYDIASDAGVLVFDADGNGVAGESGRELFGDISDLDGDRKPDGYYEGFEALTAMVVRARRQGVLPAVAADPARLGPEDLASLGKAYSLGMRVGGLLKKTVTLEEAGVSEIFLSASPSVWSENFDGQGNDVVRRDGARFIRPDGSAGAYEDVFFRFEKPQLLKVKFDARPSGGVTRESPGPR